MRTKEDRQQLLVRIFLIFLIGCIIGWIYEMFFYRINDGRFIKRGQGFGPWLPIYGVGALAITAFLYKRKNSPVTVFLGSCFISGVIELAVGWTLFHFAHGLRLWDYNVEIWNWGNIGGYICFRSILVFGFAGLLCIYMIVPAICELTERIKRVFLLITVVPLGVLLAADIVFGYFVKPIMRIL